MSMPVNTNAENNGAPEEHHLVTTRTGRYFTTGADGEDAREVWFALHGYAQLAPRFLRHFRNIVPADTLVVAPEGLSRFYLEMPRADRGHMQRIGATWMTREDREADMADTRAWLDRVYREVIDGVTTAASAAPQVTVLAFSQGVAIAMRWIAGGVVKPTRVILWAGSTATDVDAEAFRAGLNGAEVVLVTGTRDEFFTKKARETLRGQWAALGVPVREVSYEGVHELDAGVLAELLQVNRL